jgi:hypothetical protein
MVPSTKRNNAPAYPLPDANKTWQVMMYQPAIGTVMVDPDDQ